MQTHTVKADEEASITFKSSTLAVDKHLVKSGDGQKINLSFEAEAKDGLADEADVEYICTEGKNKDKIVDLTAKLNSNKYAVEMDVDKDFGEGGWKINFISLHSQKDASTIIYNSLIFEGMGEDLNAASFTANSAPAVDSENPKFKSISISKNKANPGDKIKITVNATDNVGLANEGNLTYADPTGNPDNEKSIDLKLENGALVGELSVDENMAKGLWKVSFISLSDASDNTIGIYNTKLHGDMGEAGADLSAADLEILSKAQAAPVITITGVEDGKTYTSPVTPKISVDNKDAAVVTTLNDKPYDGKEIKDNGEYTLKVVATDKAGNKSEKTIKFVINIPVVDTTAPVITITGVEDGKTYTGTVTPKISVDDKDAAVVTTLNGKPYDGKEIKDAGEYTLKVVATDKAGNKSEKTIKFVVKSDSTNGTGTGTTTNNNNGTTTTNTNSSDKKMPKTGSPVDTLALVLAGSAAAALGFVLTRKKRMN